MLKIIKDSTLVPTPIVDLKLDAEPRQGSTDPVTSDGVKSAIDGAVGDASAALQEQIDEIAEKAGSGYIPKGEATVATLNALSGQENGWLYTMTDAGTLTDGSLAVVAGDTVAWDEANSVWYKAMDYAPRQYGTNEVHNLPTTITAFRTDDVIPVDGPSGTAKMAKDNLLAITAENATEQAALSFIKLEQGGINVYGNPVTTSTRLRSVDYITGNFKLVAPAGFRFISVFYFDEDDLSFDSSEDFNESAEIGRTGYVAKFTMAKVDTSQNITPEEVQIYNDKFALDTDLESVEANLSTTMTQVGNLTNNVNLKTMPNSQEMIPTEKIHNYYVKDDGSIASNSNFNVWKFDVSKFDEITLFVATGGGYCVFVDSNGDKVGNSHRTPEDYPEDRYYNKWATLTKPVGAVELRVTQAYVNVHSRPLIAIGSGQSLTEQLLERFGSAELKPLSGKKVLCIGDSITDQARWTSTFETISGASVWNRGVSGSCIAKATGYTNSFCERFNLAADNSATHSAGFPSASNVDAVIVFGGTNDWGNVTKAVPFGSIEDAITQDTYCGAIKYLLRGLKSRYEGKQIFFLSLMNAQSSSFPSWSRVTYSSDDESSFTYRKNFNDKTMEDYKNAARSICELYGVPFVDMFDCGISPLLASDATNYFDDGLHPNQDGANIIAKYILGQILSKFTF